MKHIDKYSKPVKLEEWKEKWRARNNENVKLEDLYTQEGMTGKKLWRTLGTSKNDKRIYSKQELKDDLIKEQGYICCYCNREISNENTAIEHFKEKGKSENFHLTFEYENLLLSCDGYRKKPQPRDVCCDTKRKQNEDLLLSPLQDDIEEHFDFTLEGEIIGLTAAAKKMIESLGLGIYDLEILRETYIKDAIYEFSFDDNKTLISIDEAQKEIERLQQLKNAKFEPFCTAIIKVLENEIIHKK